MTRHRPAVRLSVPAPARAVAGSCAGRDADADACRGEPQHDPAGLRRRRSWREHAGSVGEISAAGGTPDHRAAVADWLVRALRPGPRRPLDPARMIIPVSGTREALFQAGLMAVPARPPGDGAPALLMPNPIYHVYYGAAAAAGAEAVLLPATAETGFPAATSKRWTTALLDRTALAYLCNPANPQGAVADLDRLVGLDRAGARHDFVLAVDECYAEIYRDAPPPGALRGRARRGKRRARQPAGLPFAVQTLQRAGPALRFRRRRPGADRRPRPCCAAMAAPRCPLPILAAGARRCGRTRTMWRPTARIYRTCSTWPTRVSATASATAAPKAASFLWLDVGDGEAAARRLWREAGVKVHARRLHGPRRTPPGRQPGRDPIIRVALVHDRDALRPGAGRRWRHLCRNDDLGG